MFWNNSSDLMATWYEGETVTERTQNLLDNIYGIVQAFSHAPYFYDALQMVTLARHLSEEREDIVLDEDALVARFNSICSPWYNVKNKYHDSMEVIHDLFETALDL